MTYGKEYQLADKLAKQFKGRGSDVSGMQASSTADLMRRAEMGHDPKVNCAEQAFRENYRTRQGTAQNAGYTPASRRSSSAGTKKPPREAYEKASSGRTASYAKSQTASARNEHTRRNQKSASRVNHRTAEDFEEAVFSGGAEVKVKQKGISSQFIALLVLGTIMAMILVLAISDAYITTGEIARLEADLAELQTEAEELRLQLEEKNDIRVIEEIATKQLGMVKEDSLQRRYISLSDGEYIELLNTEEEGEDQTGGVLLSSIFSSLGELFERFK